MGTIGLGQRVLSSQKPLCGRAVSLSLAVLLECVGYRDRPVAQVLSIHCFNSGVRGLEAGIVDEGKTLGIASFGISLDLWCCQDDAKCRECVIQQLLINLWIKIADEDVGTNVQILLVRRCLIHPHRLSKEFNHVHDLYRVVGIILTQELNKTVALMLHGDSVLGHVHIDNWSCLHEELP